MSTIHLARRLSFLSLLVFSVSMSGCQNTTPPAAAVAATTTTTTTTTTAGPPATATIGGTTYSNSAFYVGVLPPPGVTMVTHAETVTTAGPVITQAGWSTQCTATGTLGTSSTFQDVICIVEAEELDLYMQGYTLQVNVPAGMCSYFEYNPYYYYQFEPANGPTTVSLTVGTPSPDATFTHSGGSGNGAATISYDGTALHCSANYSDPILYPGVGGPNCCEGSYTLNTTTTGATPPTVTSTATWGGQKSNCLVGPAMSSQPKDKAGYPEPMVYALNATSHTGTYVIASPVSQQLASNLAVSNYFLPTAASVAVGTAATATYGITQTSMAIQGPTGVAKPTNPYYEFGCLDAAADYIARIRVLVRAWSGDSAFAAAVSAGVYGGNAQNASTEPSPFGSQPMLDRRTWPNPGGNGYGAPMIGVQEFIPFASIPVDAGHGPGGGSYPQLGN